jgi:hypothetical protein
MGRPEAATVKLPQIGDAAAGWTRIAARGEITVRLRKLRNRANWLVVNVFFFAEFIPPLHNPGVSPFY